MTPPPHRLVVSAVCTLSFSTAFVLSRYYKSAAFERPIHFSILTLLFSGLALSAYARYVLRVESSYELVDNGRAAPKLPAGFFIADTLRSSLRSSPSFVLLFFCLVGRTILYWRTIRTIHCSWDGLQTFLPFVLAIYDVLGLRPIHLSRHTHEIQGRTTSSAAYARYVAVSLIWGLAATDTFLLTERGTGAICPSGWFFERMIPIAQLTILVLDAVLMYQMGKLRQSNEAQSKIWQFLATLFLVSASALAFLSIWSSIDRANLRWNLSLTWLVVVDLIADSLVVVIGIISGIYLLGIFQPTTVSLWVSMVNVFVYIQWRIVDGTMINVWSNWWGFATGVFLFLGAGALLQISQTGAFQRQPTGESIVSRNRYSLYTIVAFLLVFCQTVFMSPRIVHSTPGPIIANAWAESDAWLARATTSRSLGEAVAEYKERHGIPPPPNFDRWYNFATSVESPIIDTFDQIHVDLLPYWGVLPAILRQRTTHLLEHPSLSVGGIIIEGGKIEISPHILGTHRWMMDVMKEMIEPFARWLPDMQLAFNLDDECRVSIPLDHMKDYLAEAQLSRTKLAAKQKLVSFTNSQESTWTKDFLSADDKIWNENSPWFSTWSKNPIFYEWISPTCPTHSPVHKYHWWNRKAECLGCSAPHMTNGFLSNWTLSGDLCHQPDLAYLHGVLSSPSAMAPSHALFPVFSQSRLNNFADILYPSPWNFADKVSSANDKTIPWDEKLNSVYWRGASSDGFAAHGAWQTFLRARFVHMAAKAKASLTVKSFSNFMRSPRDMLSRSASTTTTLTPPTPLEGAQPITPAHQVAINVSFVGAFNRCDERDCIAEHTTFYGSPTAEPPPSLDFQEHWLHRHLIDLDGAAFSGRFLPFLKSASLPYRAALFRTWWEERVHPWRHFVPLDVRLGELWKTVGYFGESGKGSAEAEEIAQAGREWALQSLRKEDMQVYMFRLLLEWGRIVDDRREDLGFQL
ncbi:glycosyltransferase family 90 protein [Xylariaceae sp. FL0662B]|nr:glycosyltransferase family 90 protein [Xylariaceae sp. FL0662B]